MVVSWVAFAVFAVVEVIVVLRNRSRGGGWPTELDRDSKRRVRVVIWVAVVAGFVLAGAVPAAAIGVPQSKVMIRINPGPDRWVPGELGRHRYLPIERVGYDRRICGGLLQARIET